LPMMIAAAATKHKQKYQLRFVASDLLAPTSLAQATLSMWRQTGRSSWTCLEMGTSSAPRGSDVNVCSKACGSAGVGSGILAKAGSCRRPPTHEMQISTIRYALDTFRVDCTTSDEAGWRRVWVHPPPGKIFERG
jgi:hypothetical protein